jgi:hypothetical protein
MPEGPTRAFRAQSASCRSTYSRNQPFREQENHFPAPQQPDARAGWVLRSNSELRDERRAEAPYASGSQTQRDIGGGGRRYTHPVPPSVDRPEMRVGTFGADRAYDATDTHTLQRFTHALLPDIGTTERAEIRQLQEAMSVFSKRSHPHVIPTNMHTHIAATNTLIVNLKLVRRVYLQTQEPRNILRTHTTPPTLTT